MTLYLKYRPQDFSSLVGQEFIKTTLKKAVAQDKTVGAYMFTGPRGTGKTSTARIFAKAINCTNLKNGDPCGECEICQAFQNDSLIDVIEIDAASHTGVDNIREIIERAQFQPSHAKYKVYIVDEVHMLSKGAFNALLKILEEPPSHVKFILATTDIHKVPDTILSRCQRYDFTNFMDEEIRGRLEFIAGEEGIQVDSESYDYIVTSAEGGMRNAVSLFEQLIVDNTISFSHIEKTLGVTKQEERDNFLRKMIQYDISIIEEFKSLVEEGKNVKNFLKEVAYLLQTEIEKDLNAGKDIKALLLILEILEDTLRKTKNSFDENLTLQMGLYKVLSFSGGDASSVPPTVEKTKLTPSSKETGSKEVQNDPEPLPVNSIEDIFSPESPENIIEEKKIVSSDNFDITAFIGAVKSSGGKAALIMSLKGSKFTHSDDILTITANTKISRNTLEKSENKEILLEVGETFGTPFHSVTVS